jgi:hypothetical protein
VFLVGWIKRSESTSMIEPWHRSPIGHGGFAALNPPYVFCLPCGANLSYMALSKCHSVLTRVMKSRIRDLRPAKNSKGRYPLFRSPPFDTVVVPRPNPLVEVDAIRQYIVSCHRGAPRRSPARQRGPCSTQGDRPRSPPPWWDGKRRFMSCMPTPGKLGPNNYYGPRCNDDG